MYHKVKFFERVKLERAIKRHERALAGAGAGGVDSSDDAEEDRGASSTAEAGAGGHADKAVPAEPAEIREMLAKLKEDLQYVLNFPKGEKYVSILKNVEDPEAQKHLETERERLRGVIRMQLAEVAAVTEADEGRALLGDKALAAAVSAAVSSKAAPAKRKGDKPGMPAVRVVQPRKAVARGGNGRKRRDEGEDSPETSEAASDDFFLADGSEEGGPDRPESDQEGKEDDGGDSDGESEEDIAAPKPLPPAAKARPSSKAPVGAAAAGPASAMTIKTQAVAPGAGSKRGQAFLVAGGGAEDGAEEDDFFLAAGSDDDQPAAGSSYKLQTAPPDPATRAAVGAPADWTKGRDGAKGQARPERGVGEGRGHERGPGQEGEMGRGRGAARGGMGRGGRGRGFRQPTPPPTEGKPLRTRAEGGRKRRK
ncbi:hypothetical protein HYH03_016555 [Edaphochlamys debaryana]|uniref:rRNA-processing protein EFG1 n=1 Tax=Edaphochlamys debaryana TaxID=47281 RepID=A0A835XIF6_9CHLO|nr:hypothetical protein HYH03_016555 [Edaphochlamys debaryana]|eukprot:KAG2484668.1 hypothetical protein HYH03_016555 [Edaphochlamys debaryana]